MRRKVSVIDGCNSGDFLPCGGVTILYVCVFIVATTTYSGYDAALYSAATMYVAQQAQPNTAVTTVQTTAQKTTTNTWQGYKKPGLGAGTGGMMKAIRQKLQPKPQQLHYCDVCKISCAGPQVSKKKSEESNYINKLFLHDHSYAVFT